jgi:hypothetical protein
MHHCVYLTFSSPLENAVFPGTPCEVDHDEASMPVVAIDGKTLRHRFYAFNDRKATHVLGAFAIDDTLILGHLEVNQKSNEISAAQAMIEALALAGRLLTLDAMHC